MPFLATDRISLHYQLEGSSGPTVVLLHEIGGSLESWNGLAGKLAERFRVLRYDQRGFGRSEKVRQPYTLEALVDDLRGVVQALELEAPYHLVSVAASGMQALGLYERDPRAVASLVFCNPAPNVDPGRASA